jgi:NAD(P)-dependent dehydrogenase (short-subunit alcohol dehydrogenase family)
VQLDVDDDGSASSAVEQVLAERGQIDVLVNNAGIGAQGPVEEVAIDVFRRIMETNFFGGLRCIKAVVPGMRERRSGCIINITSVASRLGASPQGPYAASKWALEGRCRTEAVRCSRRYRRAGLDHDAHDHDATTDATSWALTRRTGSAWARYSLPR